MIKSQIDDKNILKNRLFISKMNEKRKKKENKKLEKK